MSSAERWSTLFSRANKAICEIWPSSHVRPGSDIGIVESQRRSFSSAGSGPGAGPDRKPGIGAGCDSPGARPGSKGAACKTRSSIRSRNVGPDMSRESGDIRETGGGNVGGGADGGSGRSSGTERLCPRGMAHRVLGELISPAGALRLGLSLPSPPPPRGEHMPGMGPGVNERSTAEAMVTGGGGSEPETWISNEPPR